MVSYKALNTVIVALPGTAFCSNRTFMELKYYENAAKEMQRASSNRTFMELKWRTRSVGSAAVLF